MNCDRAANLISARIDGQLAADDAIALDGHLAECAACRAALGELEVADAALVRAFAPRQAAAADVADRVIQILDSETSRDAAPSLTDASTARKRNTTRGWLGWAAAAAVGFVAALLGVQLASRLNTPRPAAAAAAVPVAHLTLSTGEVFTCPSDEKAWRPIAPGDAVAAGSRVKTADNVKCELKLSSGACVRLNGATQARLLDAANVQVDSGQIWSNLSSSPAGKPSVQVTAGAARVLSASTTQPADVCTVDVTCNSGTATVSAFRGSVFVCPTSAAERAAQGTVVRGGEVLQVPPGGRVTPKSAAACSPMIDPVLSARWQDDLLVLKPADDPEVIARAAELLKRITGERADLANSSAATQAVVAGGGPGPVEQQVRAQGQAWSASFACVVRQPAAKPDRDTRRTAAQFLADLAPPRCIPDLIELLADEDGEVRRHAAEALKRLTGQTLGYPPERCAAERDLAAVVEWRVWWQAQKMR